MSVGSHPTESEAALPAEIRQWVEDRLPGIATVVDVSWNRDSSMVWRVASDTAEVFVKIHPTAESHGREVRAYQHAERALPSDGAPRLLAADPALRAVMTSPLPGVVVRGLSLEPAVESRVHESAGRLLRRWHDGSTPPSTRERVDVRTALATQAEEAGECLVRTADHLTDAQSSLVRQASRELPDLADQLPIVFCHGDYSPRNWLWDSERGGCGLIDFERAHHDIAVTDLVWLCGAVWPGRRDLEEAFLTGYGRGLTEDERRGLLLLTVRLAVSYLNTGISNDVRMLVERGRNTLSDLVSAHT